MSYFVYCCAVLQWSWSRAQRHLAVVGELRSTTNSFAPRRIIPVTENLVATSPDSSWSHGDAAMLPNDDFRFAGEAESRGADVIAGAQAPANVTRQLPCGGGPWTACRDLCRYTTVWDRVSPCTRRVSLHYRVISSQSMYCTCVATLPCEIASGGAVDSLPRLMSLHYRVILSRSGGVDSLPRRSERIDARRSPVQLVLRRVWQSARAGLRDGSGQQLHRRADRHSRSARHPATRARWL